MRDINGLRGLNVVRVDKEFLLEKLNDNRKQHRETYEKAMKGWHLKTISKMKRELKKVQADKTYTPNIHILKPISYVEQYGNVIDMLNASLDTEFVLTSQEFSQYVRDEWSWTGSFTTTVSGCLSN